MSSTCLACHAPILKQSEDDRARLIEEKERPDFPRGADLSEPLAKNPCRVYRVCGAAVYEAELTKLQLRAEAAEQQVAALRAEVMTLREERAQAEEQEQGLAADVRVLRGQVARRRGKR